MENKEIKTEMTKNVIKKYMDGNMTIEEYFNEIKLIENIIKWKLKIKHSPLRR